MKNAAFINSDTENPLPKYLQNVDLRTLDADTIIGLYSYAKPKFDELFRRKMLPEAADIQRQTLQSLTPEERRRQMLGIAQPEQVALTTQMANEQLARQKDIIQTEAGINKEAATTAFGRQKEIIASQETIQQKYDKMLGAKIVDNTATPEEVEDYNRRIGKEDKGTPEAVLKVMWKEIEKKYPDEPKKALKEYNDWLYNASPQHKERVTLAAREEKRFAEEMKLKQDEVDLQREIKIAIQLANDKNTLSEAKTKAQDTVRSIFNKIETDTSNMYDTEISQNLKGDVDLDEARKKAYGAVVAYVRGRQQQLKTDLVELMKITNPGLSEETASEYIDNYLEAYITKAKQRAGIK